MTKTFWFEPDEHGAYTLPDGIYFGLSEDIYHADGAFGSTTITALAENPCLWQYNRLRPRSEIVPEYLTWGRAWHCRVLEGKAAFDSRYAKMPKPDDFPGCLVTSDDVKEFLRMNGQRLTGAKAELIARAKMCDGCPPVYDELLAAWRADHPDYVELSPRQVQEIEDAVSNMQRDPVLSAVMHAGTLIDGAAEMSIFFTKDGIRRKARTDYALAPAGNRIRSLIVDLKSFTTFREGTDEEAAIRKIFDQGYDIQTATYLDAIDAAKKLLSEGMVFGPAPRAGYLESFLSAPIDWVWVMMRRDAGMIPITLSIDAGDPVIEHAKSIVESSLETYRAYVERFGLDQLWTPPPRLPRRLTAADFPSYNRGILYEQPSDR